METSLTPERIDELSKEARQMSHKDLLTDIRLDMKGAHEQLKFINGTIKDHEKRIRSNEQKLWKASGISIGIAMIALVLGIFGSFMGLFG